MIPDAAHVPLRLDVYTGAGLRGQTLSPTGAYLDWNFAHGWTFASSSVVVADCPAASTWTLPVGLGVASITVMGRPSVSGGTYCLADVARLPGIVGSLRRPVTTFLFPQAQAK